MSKPRFDLLIHGGQVISDQGVEALDIAVKNGQIVALAPFLTNNAARTIDATNKLVFPGFIDAHTHMRIPIMDTFSADDFEAGSIAAACGGVTTILDFTVQQKGQSLQQSVETRLQKAQGKSHVDFGLHVNVTDQPEKWLDQIPELISRGFTSFKVFSTYRQAGMMVNWEQFRQILRQVSSHGGLLMLHAEDNHLVERSTEQHVNARHWQPIYHARSRTPEAEAKAITQAAKIAGELDASLYIVHLSSEAGLEAGLKAREQGVKLYLETCPQYLLLNEERYLGDKGHYYITTPPLRTEQDSKALWQALAAGAIDVVATDHCPFTREQKDSGNGVFHRTPNGLPGVETLFPLLYTCGVAQGRIKAEQLVRLLAKNPARIFSLWPRKGEIRVGADADLVIWDPNYENKISVTQLHGNADWSPYEGMRISGKLEYTVMRGQILVEKERFVGNSILGELLFSYYRRTFRNGRLLL